MGIAWLIVCGVGGLILLLWYLFCVFLIYQCHTDSTYVNGLQSCVVDGQLHINIESFEWWLLKDGSLWKRWAATLTVAFYTGFFMLPVAAVGIFVTEDEDFANKY